MKAITRSVFVSGQRYPVQETAFGLKAHLFGQKGWNAVYAKSYTQLVRRIRFALERD